MAGDFHFRRLETPSNDYRLFCWHKGGDNKTEAVKMKKVIMLAMLVAVVCGCAVLYPT
jgi:hypothetical protein